MLTRRRFIANGCAAAGTTLAMPSISRAADRPQLSLGVQSGDVSTESGMLWARADRPARFLFEAATTDSFQNIIAATEVDALPDSDFTAKALLEDLPPGQNIVYRVRAQSLSSPTVMGPAVVGRFRTASDAQRSVSFVWSGDTAGQGWGIDESRGGMRTYATMLRQRPDFFIHSGDCIYADCPIEPHIKLPNGEVWRNVVTEEKSEVAETLAQFRGNYRYNLLDANVRAFNAEVPILAQWDDHEVANDWWPARTLDDPAYRERSAMLLAARASRAFHEYMPTRQTQAEIGRVYRKIGYGPLLDVFMLDMRSYRTSNETAPQEDRPPLLGTKQLGWLKKELARSQAVWKVIAADLPIGLVTPDGIASGDAAVLGREHEICDLLSFINRAGIQNMIWLTADMHYTAAHHYYPNRAVFQDFAPFWEFVSGPLHAGTWMPAPLDNTFGPAVRFQKGCTPSQGENMAPCFGLQFFGLVNIDGGTGAMTVTLKDVHDHDLWSIELTPERVAPRASVARGM